MRLEVGKVYKYLSGYSTTPSLVLCVYSTKDIFCAILLYSTYTHRGSLILHEIKSFNPESGLLLVKDIFQEEIIMEPYKGVRKFEITIDIDYEDNDFKSKINIEKSQIQTYVDSIGNWFDRKLFKTFLYPILRLDTTFDSIDKCIIRVNNKSHTDISIMDVVNISMLNHLPRCIEKYSANY